MYCVYKNFLINKSFNNFLIFKNNPIFLNLSFLYFRVFKNYNLFFSVNKLYLKKHFNFLLKFNNFLYSINNFNKLYFFKFINILNNFFAEKKNFLFIDNDYKYIIPFYNYVYGLKNIYSNKNYFFIKKSLLTFNNWVYFYNSFIKRFNICFLFFLNYNSLKNFFVIFTKINLPLISLIPIECDSVFLDYYFYVFNKNLNISKFLFYNYIINLYFYNYSLISFKQQFTFINLLFKTN